MGSRVTNPNTGGGNGDANDADDAKIRTDSDEEPWSEEDETAYADFMGEDRAPDGESRTRSAT